MITHIKMGSILGTSPEALSKYIPGKLYSPNSSTKQDASQSIFQFKALQTDL